jgi:trigger factor
MDAFKKTLEPEANKRIGYRLMMDAIVEKEGLTVSDKEFDDGINESAKQYGMKKEDFLKEIKDPELFRYDLLMRKAMKVITESNDSKETKEDKPKKETKSKTTKTTKKSEK